MAKNIQMKSNDGKGNWEELFPKTKASIVDMGNGETLNDFVNEILRTIQTKSSLEEVHKEIEAVVGSAPAALDTLQELAKALNDDANFANSIAAVISKKVDKVSGKQLSTEDFTAELKAKLEKLKMNADGSVILPTSYAAESIVQDGNHRFVTDQEKAYWNSKSRVVVSATEDKSADIWFEIL